MGFETRVLSRNLPPIIPEFLTGGSYIVIMSSANLYDIINLRPLSSGLTESCKGKQKNYCIAVYKSNKSHSFLVLEKDFS